MWVAESSVCCRVQAFTAGQIIEMMQEAEQSEQLVLEVGSHLGPCQTACWCFVL
jgi:hypothetical protein